MKIQRIHSLSGEITVPGDKSISHRSVMFGALAKGTTTVRGFLQGADCLSSIACFKSMGIPIENDARNGILHIHGKGLYGLCPPQTILDAGNSGTTTRLISGILAAQPFISVLTGDASIQKRPMKRIITPLSMMGAKIESQHNNGCAPLKITGGRLHGIHYTSPVASAQVKSAILLAGLYADSPTMVTEPALSRNHTELMLSAFGALVTSTQNDDNSFTAKILPASELFAQDITVPGDISSAAYFIVAGLITPGASVTVKNVGINPTRDGLLRVCQAMGAHIRIENIRTQGSEPVADITASFSSLKGTTVEGDLIPTLIDEIPAIAVLSCFAQGTTIIRDAQELKVKESNRIDAMVHALSAMGADIEATKDGMIIHGGAPLHGAHIDSHFDHRIAMSLAIAGINSDGITEISNPECIQISYPGFFEDLKSLTDTSFLE